MQKNYIQDIDFVRALSILGVLVVHVTALPTVSLGVESSLYPLYLFLNRFAKLGTTTFIFLSSFVLFYSYFSKPFTKDRMVNFYKRRMKYIMIPYFLWSFFYLNYSLYLLNKGFSDFSWVSYIKHLITGNSFYHLYFVVINIQLYLLFPLLLMFLQRRKEWIQRLFWIGLIVQWSFYFFNLYYLQTPYKGSISLSYFSYYFLGAFAGVYYDRIVKWMKNDRLRLGKLKIPFWGIILILWSISGLWNVAIYYNAFGKNQWISNFWYELGWNVYSLASIVFLYFLAQFIFRHAARNIKKILLHLGRISFGIYLIHPFFLNIWERIPFSKEPIIYHPTVFAGLIFVLICSWITSYIIHRYIPFGWILIGQNKLSAKKHKRATFVQTGEKNEVDIVS